MRHRYCCADADERRRVINRKEFALDLLKEAAAVPNISLHFESSVSSIDFESQEATIECESSEQNLKDASRKLCKTATPAEDGIPKQLQFDLLVGADGSASLVCCKT